MSNTTQAPHQQLNQQSYSSGGQASYSHKPHSRQSTAAATPIAHFGSMKELTPPASLYNDNHAAGDNDNKFDQSFWEAASEYGEHLLSPRDFGGLNYIYDEETEEPSPAAQAFDAFNKGIK